MHAAGSRVRRRNKASGPQETGGRWSGGPSGPELDTGRESRRPDTGPSQGDVLDHVPQAAGAPGLDTEQTGRAPVCTCRTALTLRGPVRSAALSPHFIEELMGAQPGLPPRRSAPACSHDPVTMACTDAELLSEDLRLPSCRDRLIHGPWGGGGEARAQDDLEVLTLCEVETCLDMRDLVWATAGSGDDRAD
ncbi:uncharacterized protein WM277_000681 isoform 2-T3 [Molossus nigricans]